MAGTHTHTTFSSAMEINPVQIVTGDSPNPARELNYYLICRSHRIRVVVTSNNAIAHNWVSATRHRRGNQFRRGRLVVGRGVQWTPAGASTIHLCAGHHCLIFQLAHAAKFPIILQRFLSNPNITFVGVGNCRDVALLSDSHLRLQVPRVVDLRRPANSFNGCCSLNASMETLASLILGWDGMVKEEWVGRSDWDRERLSVEQVKYASLDAFLSHLIGECLGVSKFPAD